MAKQNKAARTSKQRKPKRKYHEIYGVGHGFDDNANSIDVMLSMADAELWVIGAITVQWGFLEHALLLSTAKMARRAKMEEMPDDAYSLSFKRRLATWRLTAQTAIKSKRELARLLTLGQRIARVATDRHHITHGLWRWFVQRPKQLEVYSFRPGVHFSDPRFSYERMLKIEGEVARINYELSYPYRKNPKDQFWKQMGSTMRHGAFASRRLLLETTGNGDLLAKWSANPPVRPPLPPSFQELLQQAVDPA